MRKNEIWVYRELYNCHYLMDITTNEVLCVSPLVGKLFYDRDLTVDSWARQYNINEETKDRLIKFFLEKGVIKCGKI